MKDMKTAIRLVKTLESKNIDGEEKLRTILRERDTENITPEEAMELIRTYFKTPKDIVMAYLTEPDIMTRRISEVVFDIMDATIWDDFRKHPNFDDSRYLFETILDWAYEFEADWLLRDNDFDYIGTVEDFACKKMIEYMREDRE